MKQSGLLSSHQKSVDFAQRSIDLFFIYIAWLLFAKGRSYSEIDLLMLCLIGITFQLTASLSGVYASQRSASLGTSIMRVIGTTLITFATLAIAAYLSNRLKIQTPRLFMFEWCFTTMALLSAWRVIYRPILGKLRSFGLNSRRAAVVGSSEIAEQLIVRLRANDWMGIDVVGHFHHHASAPEHGFFSGDIELLLSDARAGNYDLIYLALPLQEEETLKYLVNGLADSACSVFLVPDIFTFELLHARTHLIDGLPAISIYDTPFTMADQFLKRVFDLGVSLMALIMLAPILTTVAIAIKVTSHGPVLFKQTRYGLNGRAIKVWKFRSMNTMDDGQTIRQAQKNDSRLTPIGSFLRRSSLDELPQFINVLTGSMSIVGPRPHAVAHNEQYRKLIPGYMLRHKVKPGITGWAQVNGWRGETETLDKMNSRIHCDIEYIRRWSLWLDFKILLLTIFRGFFSKNAY